MTFYSSQLSEKHRRQLLEGSSIAPEIAAERGYRTATRRSEVPEAFKDYQRRPGLVIPMYSPDGESTSYQLRPDKPRRGGPKYETPAGSEVLVDVHPRMFEEVRSGTRDLWITEGVKKGDALTSRGLPALALAGAWMWCVPKVRPYKLKPCFDHVQLKGRRVYVVFDSDALTKWEVQQALEALVKALEERGAEVLVVYLEDTPDGSKVGVDDYLAAGGTINELKMLARKFVPKDLERIRLSRDDRLRALVEDLRARWWAEEWKGRGGHSDRDIAHALIEAAGRSGATHPDGVRVVVSWGALEVRAKVSRRTLAKGLARLEERGFLYRDNDGRKAEKAGAFVLRAKVNQYGGTAGQATRELRASDPGGLHSRALPDVPRLRWSRPAYAPKKRGFAKGTRRVRESKPPPARERIERLGKIRGAILDVLDDAGGTATLQEIAEALHRKRPRDIRRRNLPMLEEAGILAVDGDTVTLADNWLGRLEEARELGQEIEADELAEEARKRKSRAYHNRHKANPDPHWTNNPDAGGAIEDLRPADDALQEEPEKPEPKQDPAVAVVLDYVTRLGKIRLGLLEAIWLEDHGGALKELRRAVDESGVRKERLREYRDAVFLYPPAPPVVAA